MGADHSMGESHTESSRVPHRMSVLLVSAMWSRENPVSGAKRRTRTTWGIGQRVELTFKGG